MMQIAEYGKLGAKKAQEAVKTAYTKVTDEEFQNQVKEKASETITSAKENGNLLYERVREANIGEKLQNGISSAGNIASDTWNNKLTQENAKWAWEQTKTKTQQAYQKVQEPEFQKNVQEKIYSAWNQIYEAGRLTFSALDEQTEAAEQPKEEEEVVVEVQNEEPHDPFNEVP